MSKLFAVILFTLTFTLSISFNMSECVNWMFMVIKLLGSFKYFSISGKFGKFWIIIMNIEATLKKFTFLS